jgi:hypothetical protein
MINRFVRAGLTVRNANGAVEGRRVMNKERYVLIGLGLALLISTPSYSQRPPQVTQVFTPFIRNLGVVDRAVVNVDTSPHDTSIQVIFNDQTQHP